MPNIKYHYCFLNGERAAITEFLECADDAAAVIEADKILAGSVCRSIEVWDGNRQVSILSRKDPAT
jgi:hypothetical protein